MNSRYGISGAVLAELRLRDQNCVYCGVLMPDRVNHTKQQHFATIEHLYPPGNNPTWVSWCCNRCNASHKKPLRQWFSTPYCIKRGINENSVAPIIKKFLASGLKESDVLWISGPEDAFLKSAKWSECSPDGQQSIHRSMFQKRAAKSFDRVMESIRKRRDTLEFRGLTEGTFGRYDGFMYWKEGDVLNRVPFPDQAVVFP